MSTRSNIKVTGQFGEDLWFYRHSDGYPEGAMPLIQKFMGYVRDKRIRTDKSQACGWLIMLGNQEYERCGLEPGHDVNISGWQVGSIEPTTGEHGDIEFLYEIHLDPLALKINGHSVDWEKDPEQIGEEISNLENVDSE